MFYTLFYILAFAAMLAIGFKLGMLIAQTLWDLFKAWICKRKKDTTFMISANIEDLCPGDKLDIDDDLYVVITVEHCTNSITVRKVV